MDVVGDALQEMRGEVMSITPVLCFVAAEWPLLARPFALQDVIIAWPRAILKARAPAWNA